MCSCGTIPVNIFYREQFVLICLINFENLGFTHYDTAIWRSGSKFTAKLGSAALRLKEKLHRDMLTQMLTGWVFQPMNLSLQPTHTNQGIIFVEPVTVNVHLPRQRSVVLETNGNVSIFTFLIHEFRAHQNLNSGSFLSRLENSVSKNFKHWAMSDDR